MKRMQLARSIIVSAWLGSCDWQDAPSPGYDDYDSDKCAYSPCDCAAEATAQVPASVSTPPLLVHGTARHRRQLAVRRLIVAARAATSDSFNFATWSVSLTQEDLAALPRASDDQSFVELPLEIIDEMGRTCVQRHRARFRLALGPATGDAGPQDGDSGEPPPDASRPSADTDADIP